MVEFVLCGTGWRAQFYIRIAKALPDRFRVVSIYTRREETREEYSNKGYVATTDLDAALAYPHDAVIVASGSNGLVPLLHYLDEKGEQIITETSFLSLDEKDKKSIENINGFVMEQYWYTPLYGSILSSLSLIGRIDQVYLSGLHKHHAASIARRIFSSDMPEDSEIIEHQSKCMKTGSRSGFSKALDIEEYNRSLAILRFSDNRLFINDFSSNQYHSYILPSSLEIRGERGIITEKGVRYVDESGHVVEYPFVFHRDTDSFSLPSSLSYVTLGPDVVYENEFYPAVLCDDEIAISKMLSLFEKDMLEYTISEGLKDARLGALM